MAEYRYPAGKLLIYAKAPVPGRVMTRLHGRLTPDQCAALQKRLLEHTVQTAVREPLCPVALCVAGDRDDPFIARLAKRYRLPVYPQRGDNLGERMLNGLKETLATSAFAAILGSDCACITPLLLDRACRAMGDMPVTLIPAEDGGYVLIGAATAEPRLFDNIRWGGATVLAQTRRNLRRAGLRWTELETLWDIDEPEDLDRLFAMPEFSEWKTQVLS